MPPMTRENTNNQHIEESETVEFKSSLAELKQILETLSAFSNGEGGRVFVGVGDEGQIKGVDIGRNTIENLANEIKRKTDPPLYPSIVVEEHDTKKIITIKVAKSPIKPVFAFDKAFKRVGRTNQKLTSVEIRELARYGVSYCYSAQIVKGATIDDISSGSVSKFVEQAKGRRGWTIEVHNTNEFLTKMGLVNQEGVTIAAILLFGKDPERFIVQSAVRCGRFKGTEPLEFEDFDVIGGDIIAQVDDLMSSIKKDLKMEVNIGDKPERIERWEYPLPAIREGIINAICHRDYGETSNVQVRIFDDRLEIWSPGKLPPGITVDKLRREHESIPPNPLIARPFFLSGYIENWGTGTNRIIRECAEYGLPEPEFRETGTSFVITFRKDILSEEYLKHIGLNTNQVKAVMHLKVNKKITNGAYQKLNEVSRSTAARELSALVKQGIIERHGRTGRGTVYVLKGSNDS
jgi:ATP-dependent DNA helicase RecG